MILSAEQVAAAALLGGFPGQEIPTVVAVAKGESGYNTRARNACCSGLMQIHRTAHADKVAAVGGEEKLYDPVVNMKIAFQIWAGDWCGGRAPNGHCQKWEAYGLGNWAEKQKEGARAYAQLQAHQKMGRSLYDVLAMSSSDPIGSALGAAGDALGSLGALDPAHAIAGTGKAFLDFGNRIGAWISDPQNWIRVGQVIGGAVLVMIGLRMTFNQQINATTRQIVSMVVPTGKAGATIRKAMPS